MKAYGYSHRDLGNVCPCCYDKSKPEWKKAARFGLLRLNPVTVIFPSGEEIDVFEFGITNKGD